MVDAAMNDWIELTVVKDNDERVRWAVNMRHVLCFAASTLRAGANTALSMREFDRDIFIVETYDALCASIPVSAPVPLPADADEPAAGHSPAPAAGERGK
jgi:hypothetical protein